MPKIVDHQRRREEIAGTTASLIAAGGTGSVTFEAVGRAMGTTTGAVTHYFADKDELILAALRSANGAMAKRAAIALERHADAVSIVLSVLPIDKVSREEWLVWSVFGNRASRSRPLLAELRTAYRAWEGFAVAVLQRLKDEGAIDPSLDLEIEARFVIALIDGIGLQAARDPKRWPEATQGEYIARYLKGLARG